MDKVIIQIKNSNETLQMEIPEKKKDFPSFYLLGIHKSGSSMMTNAMKNILTSIDQPMIDIESFIFSNGHNFNHVDVPADLFQKRGYAYVGFRDDFITNYEFSPDNKFILLVRDPRDAIISLFFSVKQSHVVPKGEGAGKEALLRNRSKLLNVTDPNQEIDYLMKCARTYKKRFLNYFEFFKNKQVQVYRYEDVIFNKYVWFSRMIDFIGIDVSPEIIERAVTRVDSVPESEDPSKHVRQVIPGNYRKHFNDEVIGMLNEELKDVLPIFHYDSVPYLCPDKDGEYSFKV